MLELFHASRYGMPGTLRGIALLVIVPSPSCPELLKPQHIAPRAEVMAQVWPEPIETCLAARSAATLTGVECAMNEPSPLLP